MWDLKVRKSCDRIFGVIFGITPEFHGKGVESAIMVKYYEFLELTKNPYKTMELAWIGDFNPVMNRMIETYVCATRHKGPHDLPLPVRPHEGVPPLSASGSETSRVTTKHLI